MPLASCSLPRVRDLAVGVTLLLIPLHLWLAHRLELSFDEAYYFLWSKNLAWGYLDHPPLVAFWIRASTMLFGDGQLGARGLSVVASAVAAGLVYSIAWDLVRDRATAFLAVVFCKASVLVEVGSIVVTPDTPFVFFWTVALAGLARLYRTQDARWWWLIGAAAGLALTAKYSAVFLGAGLLLALLVVPSARRWLAHPAPYLGGLLALAIFAPVIVWNSQHEWASFLKQSGRVVIEDFTPRFVMEFIAAQAGLLNPVTFVLAGLALWHAFRRTGEPDDDGRRLLAATTLPMLLYFCVHSLHGRVEGNWPAPLYPPLAVLAADFATQAVAGTRRISRWHPAWRASWVLPLGLILTAIVYSQALYGWLPVNGKADPTSQVSGWRDLGREVDATAEREDASFVLTSGYALTAELSVYGTKGIPHLQFNERIRWEAFRQPDESLFTKKGLYVADLFNDKSDELRSRFSRVDLLGVLKRRRNAKTSSCYLVYVVDSRIGEVLDPPRRAGPAQPKASAERQQKLQGRPSRECD